MDDKRWGTAERDLLYQVRRLARLTLNKHATTIHHACMVIWPANACSSPKCTVQQGLERHGVGKWAEISAELLPRWDDQAIRVKSARLLGSQSLARYVGWKGNRCAAAPHFCRVCCLTISYRICS